MSVPQENQPGEAAQHLVGSEPVADSMSSETATLRSQIEEEWKANAGKFLLEMMEDACKAARIDPTDYLPDSEGGDERGYDDKQLKMRWMRVAIAADEQLAAERAKRLEAEAQRDECLGANGFPHEKLCLAWGETIAEEHRAEKAESELLALRGGEQPDLVGPEAKADCESRPTSASFAQETVKMWMMSTGALVPASGEAKQGDFNPHVLVSVVILGPHQRGDGETSQAQPLSETKLVGEGRKVSAVSSETLELIKSRARSFEEFCKQYDGPPNLLTKAEKRERELWRELLCVLSEEGGRQKEGGTEITSASKSSEL